ncbi:Ni/Fe-hydrogenase, b-type cytochrome subunit [Ferrimonas balearica DSM 9799]|uniref:Ni/Fe-hydrogenase, b-type cytochrome subunit n=1 Tax=Ferrimonas balearica (strain DSM 9799 / CCM 4581 / KCTC 23876 / PAT) TaxID=550540 RepID=E1SVF5_FERBD|nr:Ni/Fe-hydrogenase, b-type cytochrome subunit [Ferrimonas balearica]ADN75301.1 Ni/Fe-hydrogenase, b-type cytochrome subunit [Ferrimonas balearica DSM 9799]
MTTKTLYTRDPVFTPAIRIMHWLRALSIVALVITGFYIAWPFLTPYGGTDNLQQGWVRAGHLLFGFVLVGITLARAYLYFFSRSDVERRSFRDVVSLDSWKRQLRSYLWKGKLDKAGVYGPLQYVTYLGLTLVMVFMCLSGLAMHAHVYHDGFGGALYPFAEWFVGIMGGMAPVREWHHILTWAFMIFVVIHVYMAVWSGIRFKQNSVDAIVSGCNIHPSKD